MRVLAAQILMLLIMILTAMINDGSCEFFGCTDSTAENYDSNATNDDGSCEYYCDDFDCFKSNM